MNGFAIKNQLKRTVVVIVEPIGEEYILEPGDRLEVGPPLFLDSRQIVDFLVGDGEVTLFVPEEANIKRNGELVRSAHG